MAERKVMIDRNHELPVIHQAKLLKVRRGSACCLSRPLSEAELAQMRRIDELHLKHPFTAVLTCNISCI